MDPSKIKICGGSTKNTIGSARHLYKSLIDILVNDHGIKKENIFLDVIREPASSIKDFYILMDLDSLNYMWDSTLRHKLTEIATSNKIIFARDVDRRMEFDRMDPELSLLISYVITDDPYTDKENHFYIKESLYFFWFDSDSAIKIRHDNLDHRFFLMMNLQRKHRNDLILKLHDKNLIVDNHVIYHQCPYDIAGLVKQERFSDLKQGQIHKHIDASIGPYYDQFCLELVVETLVNYVHITEKTLRPLATGMPFIIYGGKHSLRYLHTLGLMTYDRYWNEDYDDITDDLARLEAVINVLAKVTSDHKTTKKIYADSRDIRAHNLNILMDIKSKQDNIINEGMRRFLRVL